jgi:N-acetyl-anhydromuramyl-L-alanine amidase AmpD
VGKDGFVIGYGVTKNQITELEKGTLKTIQGVVLHRTASSNSESALTSFKSGIGTHFLVDKDGTIYQTADLRKITFHVGAIRSKCFEEGNCSETESAIIKSFGWNPGKVYSHEEKKSYPDRYPYYIDAVGIEVVGAYVLETKTWEKLTDKQIEAVSTLVNLLKMSYNMKFSDVYTHERISYKTEGEGQVVLDAVKDKIQDK